jgi:hypothetical protein
LQEALTIFHTQEWLWVHLPRNGPKSGTCAAAKDGWNKCESGAIYQGILPSSGLSLRLNHSENRGTGWFGSCFNGGLTVVLIVMLKIRAYQPHPPHATSRNNSAAKSFRRFVPAGPNSHVIRVHGGIGDQSAPPRSRLITLKPDSIFQRVAYCFLQMEDSTTITGHGPYGIAVLCHIFKTCPDSRITAKFKGAGWFGMSKGDRVTGRLALREILTITKSPPLISSHQNPASTRILAKNFC